MKDTNIYKYGQLIEVAGTPGLDVEPGQIIITGIMHPSILPSHIDYRSWETGDADFDFELQTEPWYFFQYTDGRYDEDNFDLPQFALEEADLSAQRKK